jgi:hypothetical protein
MTSEPEKQVTVIREDFVASGDESKVSLLHDMLFNGVGETCPDGQAHQWRLSGIDICAEPEPLTYTYECKRCRGTKLDVPELK